MIKLHHEGIQVVIKNQVLALPSMGKRSPSAREGEKLITYSYALGRIISV